MSTVRELQIDLKMAAFAIISAIILAVIVTVTPRPTADPALQDIVAIATQSCPDTTATLDLIPPEDILQINKNNLLTVLREQVLETIDELNTTLSLVKQWVNGEVHSTICTEIRLNITYVNHASLSPSQDLLIRMLMNTSSYVHLFKSQEYDTSTYTSDIASRLHNHGRNINNIVVRLGELLPMVTCDDIKTYIEEYFSGHLKTLSNYNSATKRTFIFCELEEMLIVFQEMLISF